MRPIEPLEKSALEYLQESSTNILTCAVVYSIVYGAHLALLVLAAIPIYHRIVSSSRKLPSIALFSAILLSFVTASIDTAVQIVGLVITIRTTLIEDVKQVIVAYDDSEIEKRMVTTYSLVIWTMVAQPIINDSVVLWRAWVLFPRKRWLMALPILLLLATAGTSLAFFIGTMGPSDYDENDQGGNITYFYSFATIFSLSTNVTLTLLICYKYWSFNRIFKPLVKARVSGDKSPIDRILAILVESGLVYCVFQAACIVANYTLYHDPDNHHRWRYYIFRGFAGPLSEIYPALVVCLVHYRRTTDDTSIQRQTSTEVS